MRTLRLLASLAALAAAAPAHAQRAPESVALEAGLVSPAGAAAAPLSASAGFWLDGPLEARLRFAWASAAWTSGRAADGGFALATAGLRAWLADGPLRPSVLVEVGAYSRGGRAGAAAEVSAALELFLARDVAVVARAGVLSAGALGADAAAGVAFYF